MQRKHVENFYFQKQYCELLALNNIHVGAKLNRDQTINKFIQKTIEIASGKIEKNNKTKNTVQQPRSKTGPRPARPPFLGPEARQPTARPPNRPTAAPLPFPLGPNSARPAPRSFLDRRIRSDGRPPLPRDQNPRRRRSPSNPRSFSPPSLSS